MKVSSNLIRELHMGQPLIFDPICSGCAKRKSACTCIHCIICFEDGCNGYCDRQVTIFTVLDSEHFEEVWEQAAQEPLGSIFLNLKE